MKKSYNLRYSTILVAVLISLSGCFEEPEHGFDGKLSGKITDSNGNVVSGDIKVATFSVHALGEFDMGSIVMRVNDDGSYANTMLYPQSYKVWLVGPFIGARTDTVVIDLTGGKTIAHNFQVTPLLNIPKPAIGGSPTSTAVTVNYTITGNEGRTPNLREVYCSTVSWPTRSTGSGPLYQTVTVTVTQNEGTANITGLKPNTKYYVRVGARALGQSLFNHSEQISFTTPAN
jgi:hypothetical protein